MRVLRVQHPGKWRNLGIFAVVAALSKRLVVRVGVVVVVVVDVVVAAVLVAADLVVADLVAAGAVLLSSHSPPQESASSFSTSCCRSEASILLLAEECRSVLLSTRIEASRVFLCRLFE